MSIEKAKAILTACEAELRALVAQAAKSGNYDAVDQVTSWARSISALSGSAVPAIAPNSHRQKIPAATYPRFGRRGDVLVKIGWSKREKAEYEHKAPLTSVVFVANIVKKKGADGRIFQVSTLLPCEDADGTTIPDYQVYLVIAWWKLLGLIEQHGRQGYSIPRASDFVSNVKKACSNLVEM